MKKSTFYNERGMRLDVAITGLIASFVVAILMTVDFLRFEGGADTGAIMLVFVLLGWFLVAMYFRALIRRRKR